MPFKLVPPKEGRWAHWRVRGTENGVYVDRSTGTAERKVAQRILGEWRAEAMTTTAGPRGRSPTFAAAAIAYMQAGGEKRFLRPLLHHFGEMSIASITQVAVDAAASALYPGARPSTLNRQVYTPISAIRRHVGHLALVHRPKGAQGERRQAWLKPEEAKRLLEAAVTLDERFGAFCTFLLYTGCRLGEAQALTWGDVDLDERQAFIPKTKNGKPRWVHLTPALVQTLGRLHRDRPYVFRRNREDLYRHLDDASRLSGVVIPDGVAFHLFRHTWGTWMRKFGGLDTVGMMATGAWTSRVSAEAYMHASTTPEARKADLLPTW